MTKIDEKILFFPEFLVVVVRAAQIYLFNTSAIWLTRIGLLNEMKRSDCRQVLLQRCVEKIRDCSTSIFRLLHLKIILNWIVIMAFWLSRKEIWLPLNEWCNNCQVLLVDNLQIINFKFIKFPMAMLWVVSAPHTEYTCSVHFAAWHSWPKLMYFNIWINNLRDIWFRTAKAIK